MKLRLSILITLLLVLSTLISGLVLSARALRVANESIQEAGFNNLNTTLTHLQNVLNSQLANDNLEDARLSMSVSALHPDIQALVLVDERERVLLAHRYLWEGENASRLFPYDRATARAARERQASRVTLSADGQRWIGYYPITLKLAPGGPAHSRMGVLYVEYDLERARAKARREALQQVAVMTALMLAVTLVVAVLLHWLVSRRVERLAEVAQRLAAGDLDARAGLRGQDELAALGRAFDAMAERRQEAEAELRRNEERFRVMLETSPIAVRIATDEGRRVVFANQRYAELLDLTGADIVGVDPRAYYADPAEYEAVLARLARGERVMDRLMELRIAGTGTKWVLASYLRLDYAHEPVVLGWFYDITERKRLEDELQLAASVYRHSSEAMEVVDADNRIVAINPAYTTMTGYAAEEVVGRSPSILKSGHHGDTFYAEMWRALNESGRWQGEIWDRRKNGEQFPVWLTINTLYNEDGSVYRRLALFSDITKRKQSEEMIWRQANFDSLTGLPNRRLFQDRLEHEIKQTERAGHLLALFLIDLDRFKEVNDTLGHQVGDQLLVEAAQRIAACVRESDTVARLGGDEFTVIVAPLDDPRQVERIAGDIVRRLAAPFLLAGERLFISASLGITFAPDDARDAEQLLKNADQAMYAAKNAGRNRHGYFTPALQEAARHRARLLHDLRQAVSGRQFELHFQPIVHLSDGRVYKAEALIRWRHPERGMVSPGEFIPLAEETGLIEEIGDWVFQQALHWTRRWRAQVPGFKVGLNVSPVQFQAGEGAGLDRWQEMLRAHGLSGEDVVVEITEGLLLDAERRVTDRLLLLRDLGVQVAVDDFGTGYSALSYLQKFHIDYLKIDQSFVRNLESSASDATLCEAIVSMAHRLGLEVIAEGVETAAQRALLVQFGCDYAQGYHFARPMPPEAFEDLLRRSVPDGTP